LSRWRSVRDMYTRGRYQSTKTKAIKVRQTRLSKDVEERERESQE
jgi:hypothetical protein